MPHKPFALCFLLLSACASTPEPVIKTQIVEVPVTTPCPDKRPTFRDPLPAESLANAPDIFALAKLYYAAVILYRERLNEDDAQVSACSPPVASGSAPTGR